MGVEPEVPLEYGNVHDSYRPDLPAVWRGLAFTVHPQHKVVIVGRTCAGKSSALLALFRIIESSLGQILIDSVVTPTLASRTSGPRLASLGRRRSS